MFLYLGGTTNVWSKDVLSIHDYVNFCQSEDNEELLKQSWLNGCVQNLTEEENIKSIILTTEGVYLSAISAATLRKRAVQGYE